MIKCEQKTGNKVIWHFSYKYLMYILRLLKIKNDEREQKKMFANWLKDRNRNRSRRIKKDIWDVYDYAYVPSKCGNQSYQYMYTTTTSDWCLITTTTWVYWEAVKVS